MADYSELSSSLAYSSVGALVVTICCGSVMTTVLRLKRAAASKFYSGSTVATGVAGACNKVLRSID
jgi:hypothetical protein